MLYPEDARSLMYKSMGTSYLVGVASITIFISLFGLKPSVYTAYLTLLSIVVFNHELLEYIVMNLEFKLMSQFDKFLSDTRHSFYQHGMID